MSGITGCFAGLLFFAAFIVLTSLCSVTSFSLAQQTVVDLNAAGMAVDDPLATLRCALTGRCESVTADLNASALNAPLLKLTPLTTAMPTATAQSIAPPTVAVAEPTMAPTTAPPTPFPSAEPSAGLPRITDPRQVQILLLGIDQRSATDDPGPFRTDTIMLLNINPVRKSVGLLSLPRDLWVEIPDFGGGAHQSGEFHRRWQCLPRWRRSGAGDGDGGDQFRPARRQIPAGQL